MKISVKRSNQKLQNEQILLLKWTNFVIFHKIFFFKNKKNLFLKKNFQKNFKIIKKLIFQLITTKISKSSKQKLQCSSNKINRFCYINYIFLIFTKKLIIYCFCKVGRSTYYVVRINKEIQYVIIWFPL